MWPISKKAAIKKIREYKKRYKSDNNDDLQLPLLPPSRPEDKWTLIATIRALSDRDLTLFSDNSREVYYKTL